MSKISKVGVALTSLGIFILALATYLWLFTKPSVSAPNAAGVGPINEADYYVGLSMLIFGILAVSVGLNYLAKNKSIEKLKPPVFNITGALIGLLALILSFVLLFPLKFFGIQTGTEIVINGFAIFSIAILIIGIYRLSNSFSSYFSNRAKLVSLTSNVLIVAVAIIVLFFQMVASRQEWLHVIFGVGLLSYAIGRVTFGFFAGKFNIALRAFNIMIGFAIGLFSTLIILFGTVQIYSSGGMSVYLGFGYFADITLVLIGVDLLASAIFSYF